MLHKAGKKRYWQSVALALELLSRRTDRVSVLRKKIENLPLDAQELFFHEEPFEVARILAGGEAATKRQIRDYIEKVQKSADF
jgi:hypothetical protein